MTSRFVYEGDRVKQEKFELNLLCEEKFIYELPGSKTFYTSMFIPQYLLFGGWYNYLLQDVFDLNFLSIVVVLSLSSNHDP